MMFPALTSESLERRYILTERNTLPTLNNQTHLRVVHFFGVACANVDFLNSSKEAVWEEVITMLGTASTSVNVMCLHVTGSTISSKGLNDKLRGIQDFSWSRLSRKLTKLTSLKLVLLLVDSHKVDYPKGHPWTNLPEITHHISMAVSPQLRQVLGFGTYHCRTGDTV